MNSTSKKKISQIFADLLRKRLPQQTWLGDWHYNEIIDLLKIMGMEVVKRGREEREEWDLSYARLLPPPKDDEKSVCVKIWQDKENIDPQVWVRLDRDLALKILLFGKVPENT